MERRVIEGENPVYVKIYDIVCILSTAGPEKSCGKLPAPSGKAKYS